MAVSNLAVYAQKKKTGTAVLTAAKTTYNDAANAALLYAAGSDGALVRRITAAPRATITATQLQLYRSLDGGTTLIFCGSALMPAYTMSSSTIAPVIPFDIDFAEPLSLAPSERLYVAMGNALAAGVTVVAEGEEFS